MDKTQLLQSLKQKGFSNKILNAFSNVKREDFIPKQLKNMAYDDIALPIGNGQTISQPYTIAIMLSMLSLNPGQKVLEIGSGCGYVLALISEITKTRVYGIEIIKELAEKSKQNLKDYENIEVYNRNGAEGLPEKKPFNRILISAAIKEIPKNILDQLEDKGILIAPLGSDHSQDLIAIQRKDNSFIEKKRISGFIFVPFVEKE